MSAGFVYLIGHIGGTLAKIGYTSDVETRFRALECSSPVPLKLLWSHKGTLELERKLHAEFASRRRHGEWFEFDGINVVQALSTATAQLYGSLAEPPIRRRSAHIAVDGPNIRDARRAIGINQLQLATMAKISPTHLSGLEHGKRHASPAVYARICDALGITDRTTLMAQPPVPPAP